MRIGVGERAFQTFAAEYDHETVAFAGLNDHFGIANCFYLLGQQGAEFLADRSIDASRATIENNAFVAESTKVCARRDVQRRDP